MGMRTVVVIMTRFSDRNDADGKSCNIVDEKMFSVLSMIEMVYFVGTLVGIPSRCRLAVFKLDLKASG